MAASVSRLSKPFIRAEVPTFVKFGPLSRLSPLSPATGGIDEYHRYNDSTLMALKQPLVPGSEFPVSNFKFQISICGSDSIFELNENKRLCGMSLTFDFTLCFALDILSVRQQAGLNPRKFSAHESRMVDLGDKLHVDKCCADRCRILALDDVLQQAIISEFTS